uniref:HEAT repeat-containing protein 6 n=1 Tax=Macrostomum lignano TaxID=282301 RepID=A0A1I8F757_9PLAT
MKYSESDAEALELENREDAHIPDRERATSGLGFTGPGRRRLSQHLHDCAAGGGGGIRRRCRRLRRAGAAAADLLLLAESGDADDSGGGGDDILSSWNLRKCSAAALDVLANVFRDELLEHLLPILKDTLLSERWDVKESGILILGAVAEGCLQGVTAYLPELFRLLLTCLQARQASGPLHHLLDSVPLCSLDCDSTARAVPEAAAIRIASIEFWTLINEGRLFRVRHARRGNVQRSGALPGAILCRLWCSLFSDISIRTCSYCTMPSAHWLTLLAPISNQEAFVQLLMPRLFQKWESLNDDDKDLFPLLECLSSLATALGGLASCPTAGPCSRDRCVRLVETTLRQQQLHFQNPEANEAPDKDFHDSQPGLAQRSCRRPGLGDSATGAGLANSRPALNHCMQDSQPIVKAERLRTARDLSKACFDQLRPAVGNFLMVLAANLNPVNISVCNNAIWAIGEISIRLGSRIKPYVEKIIDPLD